MTIDASVWVGAYTLERISPASRECCDFVVEKRIPMILPTIVIAEVAAGINRTYRDPELADRAVRSLLALESVQWIDLDRTEAMRVASITAATSLRAGDAVYASVAKQFDCLLISSDREHFSRTGRLFIALSPEEAMAHLRDS